MMNFLISYIASVGAIRVCTDSVCTGVTENVEKPTQPERKVFRWTRWSMDSAHQEQFDIYKLFSFSLKYFFN